MVSWLKRVGVPLAVVIGVVLLWRQLLIPATAIAALAVGAYVYDWAAQTARGSAFPRGLANRRQGPAAGLLQQPQLAAICGGDVARRSGGIWVVVLNWSERSQWRRPVSPEVALFRAFAGAREFNPLAIVVPARGRKVHVVRFWLAFREVQTW